MGLCFLKLVTVAAEVTVGVVLIHLCAHEPPNGILSGSAIFARLTVVTETQTRRCADRPRRSVRSNRPHLILRTAMPPSNKIPKTTIADICPLVGVRG